MTQQTEATARPHDPFLRFKVGDRVWWGPAFDRCNRLYSGPGIIVKVYERPWQLRCHVHVDFPNLDGSTQVYRWAFASELVLAEDGAA